MIPENLNKIRQTAREKINEQVFNLCAWIPQNIFLCLRRIETEKLVYISVFGALRLTKSFILSAVGSIFTYDLLIINTFFNQTNIN